jgi:benzoylformate decarboxylase
MDALAAEHELRYILALQEAPAMGMADGYAQASGQCAVVNLHAAPGLGNALGMLYDAQKAGAPILVTAGQHEQRFNFTEPLLWADLPSIARPFVKWSEEVRRLQDLPRAIHRAVKTALAPPTGPVFLSLPGDILSDSADLDLGAPSRVARGIRGDAGAIGRAAAIIAKARSPVIVAGDAVPQGDALAELVALAAVHWCGCRKRSAACCCSTTCWCRSAPTCSPCPCRVRSNRSRTATRSCTSTPIRGNWRRTIRSRCQSWANPKRRCRN